MNNPRFTSDYRKLKEPSNGDPRGGSQMMAGRTTFADQIAQLRVSLQLTQAELANALGVSFATVNRWENARTDPSKLALARLNEFCAKSGEAGIPNCVDPKTKN